MSDLIQQQANWTVHDIVQLVDRFAPPSLAMEGDPVGLQIGNRNHQVERIMVALDAYPDVIHEALTSGVDLLVTHHALMYRPLKRIDTSTARGQALAVALAHDLAVYTAHTNLDITDGGVNDVLADLLGLRDVTILDLQSNEPLRKLVVFVPVEAHEHVMQAICDAGAGHIGRYSHCTFNVGGMGTFLPHLGTSPTVGVVGRLERTEEVRMETIVPVSCMAQVVAAMQKAHPYEEAAYDIYPLDLWGKPFGIGRVGNLPERLPLTAFAEGVKQRLGLAHVRFGGSPTALVQRVAVLGGAGGKWVQKALEMGADVMVTSDVDHHTVAEASQDGLAVVDATHAALERPALHALAEYISSRTHGSGISVSVCSVQEDPFTWI